MDLGPKPSLDLSQLRQDKTHSRSRTVRARGLSSRVFKRSANMSRPLRCMIVFSILAQAQLISSLTFDLFEAFAVSDSTNLTKPNEGNTMRSNGTYKEVADLFNELSTLSDNVSKTTDLLGKTALRNNTAGNNSLTDAQLAEAQSDLENGSQTDSLIIGIIVANIIIFVIGFCGNSLVILVILKFTRIETVTDIYILNLAFADLMFLFGLIFLIITMSIDHWIFGTLMCKLYMASTSLNQFASSLLLVVMSFDRFLAVCHPIYAQRFRRLKRAKIICFCIWITCLILMIPIFAFAKTNKELTCAIFWPEYKSFNCEIAFTLYSFGIGFALPLLLIAAFYTCVIRKLRIAATGPLSLGSTRRSRSRETTNKRIEHLVIGIICTYTICWLPYWITQLCVSFTTLDRSPITGFYTFVLVATCLTYTNSALNPILYAFLSDNFKRRCADVFRSIHSMKWCQRPTGQDAQTTIATTIYEHSDVNSNHGLSNAQRSESRQTVVMNESIRLMASPNRYIETQRLAPTADDDLIDDSDFNNNNYHSDERGRGKQNVDNKMNAGDNETIKLGQHSADTCFKQQSLSSSIHNQTRTKGPDDVDNDDDPRLDDKIYAPDAVNNGSPGDNQARRKSVAFNMMTMVVQGPVNNKQVVKSDHKMLQVTDKKQQRRQEAV